MVLGFTWYVQLFPGYPIQGMLSIEQKDRVRDGGSAWRAWRSQYYGTGGAPRLLESTDRLEYRLHFAVAVAVERLPDLRTDRVYSQAPHVKYPEPLERDLPLKLGSVEKQWGLWNRNEADRWREDLDPKEIEFTPVREEYWNLHATRLLLYLSLVAGLLVAAVPPLRRAVFWWAILPWRLITQHADTRRRGFLLVMNASNETTAG
jgi:hypothetical protein